MNYIACAPRCWSAWLSNLLTVPGQSLYVHDSSSVDGLAETLERRTDIVYRGIVDTGISLIDVPEGARITIIEDEWDRVASRLAHLGLDPAETAHVCDETATALEALRPQAQRTYHLDDMDSWIQEFYEAHTGLPFDADRYAVLRNLHVESVLAHRMRHDGWLSFGRIKAVARRLQCPT